MHKTQLYLEDGQYVILRDMAAKARKSIAQLVREMIDAALAPPKTKEPDSLDAAIGMLSGPYSNVSEHVDDYLYGDPETVRALEKAALVRDKRAPGKARRK